MDRWKNGGTVSWDMWINFTVSSSQFFLSDHKRTTVCEHWRRDGGQKTENEDQNEKNKQMLGKVKEENVENEGKKEEDKRWEIWLGKMRINEHSIKINLSTHSGL